MQLADFKSFLGSSPSKFPKTWLGRIHSNIVICITYQELQGLALLVNAARSAILGAEMLVSKKLIRLK